MLKCEKKYTLELMKCVILSLFCKIIVELQSQSEILMGNIFPTSWNLSQRSFHKYVGLSLSPPNSRKLQQSHSVIKQYILINVKLKYSVCCKIVSPQKNIFSSPSCSNCPRTMDRLTERRLTISPL